MADCVARLESDDPSVRLASVRELRRLCSGEQADSTAQMSEVIDAGGITSVVNLLRNPRGDNEGDSFDIQMEAAWILTNLASGTTEQTKRVIDEGGIGALMSTLHSRSCNVQEQCIWGLGNIAGDSTEHRDKVLSEGLLHILLDLIQPQGKAVSFMRDGVWTLSNLLRGTPSPALEKEDVKKLVETLERIILHYETDAFDTEVFTDLCWSLAFGMENQTFNGYMIHNLKITQKTLAVFQFSRMSYLNIPCLMYLRSLLTPLDPLPTPPASPEHSHQDICRHMLDNLDYKDFCECLQTTRRALSLETLRFMSALTQVMNTEEEVERLFSSGCILALIERALNRDVDHSVGDAFLGLLDCTSAEQVSKMVHMDLIKAFWSWTKLSGELPANGYRCLEKLLKLGEEDDVKLAMTVEGFGNAFVKEVENQRVESFEEKWQKEKESFEMILRELKEDKSLLVKG